ncbi:MAG: CbiX/SirB N-terminal domain-containing protein [Peptococcaceae bacterium]|nr:CbiX/SirB N-terminal domain-containing protein [Peptococcaceae bacterium]
MKEAVLLLAHGSRRSEANEEWKNIWQLFTNRHPNLLVTGSFIEFAEPDLEGGVRLLIEQGAEKIYVVPLFLTVGNHLRQNIPERLQALREQYQGINLELTEHLGVDPLLIQIIEQRLQKQGLQLSI